VPLTPFQTTVLRLLAQNRSADSYVAGGIALNAQHPIRWSADVDLFHDVEDAVMRASDADVGILRQAGYDVRSDLWTPGFRRAWVARGDAGVEVGLAFVNAERQIGWFDQAGYAAHRATLGGALPRVVRCP